jgi:hypothetical protein
MELIGGVCPNWEIPVAPVMAGLLVKNGGRFSQRT